MKSKKPKEYKKILLRNLPETIEGINTLNAIRGSLGVDYTIRRAKDNQVPGDIVFLVEVPIEIFNGVFSSTILPFLLQSNGVEVVDINPDNFYTNIGEPIRVQHGIGWANIPFTMAKDKLLGIINTSYATDK